MLSEFLAINENCRLKAQRIGILFPPQDDGIMKIGAIHFVTNYAKSYRGMSLPRYRSDNPGDDIPAEIEARLRRWMSEFVPELAQREWVETRICW